MAEAKTVQLEYREGTIPTDSHYSLQSTLINAVIDKDGRVLQIPVAKVLKSIDYNATKDRPVVIHAMSERLSTPAEDTFFPGILASRMKTCVVAITSDFMAFNTATGREDPCNVVVLELDALTLDVLTSTNIFTQGNERVSIGDNYFNSYKVDIAIIGNYCVFNDIDGKVWCLEVGTYQGSIIGNLLSPSSTDHMYKNCKVTVKDGADTSIKTNAFFKDKPGFEGLGMLGIAKKMLGKSATDESVTLGRVSSICVLAGSFMMYNGVTSISSWFMTEGSDPFTLQYMQQQYYDNIAQKFVTYTLPIVEKQSDGQWKVTHPGAFNLFPSRDYPVDAIGVNNTLYLFGEQAISRQVLKESGGNYILVQDPSFNLAFRINLFSQCLMHERVIYFVSDDDKLFAINEKGQVKELTDRYLPDRHIFNNDSISYLKEEGGGPIVSGTRNFNKNRILNLIKVAGMTCIACNSVLYNIDTDMFSFLVPNKSFLYQWDYTSMALAIRYTYNSPYYITSSVKNGSIVSLGNMILAFPPDYNYRYYADTNATLFTSTIIITKMYEFPLKGGGIIDNIQITFKDTLPDPREISTAYRVELYVVENNVYDQALMDNLNNDLWWDKHKATVDKVYTLTSIQFPLKIQCQSAIFVFRIGAYNDSSEFAKQRYIIENILMNCTA